MLSTIELFGQNNPSTKIFDNMLGAWQDLRGDTIFEEVWKKKASDEYIITGVQTLKKDTLFKETIHLLFRDSHWMYIVKVGKAQPVLFTVVDIDNNLFEASNSEHEYPSAISYEYIDESNVKVDLKTKTSKTLDSFNLKRVKKKRE
ncbi:MAG: hypothetical protein AB7O73_12970 [Bacteroidia bacterium]